MHRLLALLGLTVGSWLGWTLGARHSFTAAFMLSIVGTGVGLYLGRRIALEHF